MKHSRSRKGRRHAMVLRARGPSLCEVLYDQAHGKCFYCGRWVARHAMTLDHVIPIAHGGTQARGNLVAACFACNASKGTLSLEAYRQKCSGRLFAGEREGE